MEKYEAMFILKPNLGEEEKGSLFEQIKNAVIKNRGSVSNASIWSEKRKLCFPIKKYQEGIYYLMNFTVEPEGISSINHTYKLNENILRVLITTVR